MGIMLLLSDFVFGKTDPELRKRPQKTDRHPAVANATNNRCICGK